MFFPNIGVVRFNEKEGEICGGSRGGGTIFPKEDNRPKGICVIK